MESIRLDKFLTQTLHKTRSEVKKELKKGTIQVNGKTENRPERKIVPQTDQVTWSGLSSEKDCESAGPPLSWEKHVWVMFHKPAGCVTAREDARQRTVMDYIDHPRKKELFPVGRLDKDTEGLLLLTNDGELSHRMLSPRHHVEKTYEAIISGTLTDEDRKAFEKGMDIGDGKTTRPALLRIVSCPDMYTNLPSRDAWYSSERSIDAESDRCPPKAKETFRQIEDRSSLTRVELTICEGRFHQVKRMFLACGCEVVYLKRIRMAGLSLDETLRPGDWRVLTKEEMEGLYTYVETDRRSDF